MNEYLHFSDILEYGKEIQEQLIGEVREFHEELKK